MPRRQKYFQPRVLSTFLFPSGVRVHSPNLRAQEEGERGFTARVSIGFRDLEEGSSSFHDLATEYLSGEKAMPWRSADDREAAMRILPVASWVDPDLRARLIEHVRDTPWYDHEFEGYDTITEAEFIGTGGYGHFDIPDSEAKSGRILVPARWSAGNYDEAPGGALDEMLRRLLPIPWLSEKHRRWALTDIAEKYDFREISDDVRQRLIEHIATAPVWACDRDMRTPFDRQD